MRRLIFMLGAIAWVLGACEDKPSTPLPTLVDSESHWLMQCETDAQCGGLQCLCNVCTLPCDAAEACAPLTDPVCQPVNACAPQGVCVPQGSTVPDQGLEDAAVIDMAPVDMAADMSPDMAADMSPDMAADMSPDMAVDMMVDAAPPPPDAGMAPVVDRYECPVAGCCNDAECPAVDGRAGICRAADVDAQNARCGPEQQANVCTAAECDVDADCAAGKRCAGEAQGVRIAQCVAANCTIDADCVERPGGQCTPFFTPCYNAGFACTYDDDPCRSDADCPVRDTPKYCQPQVGGRTICVDGVPAP